MTKLLLVNPAHTGLAGLSGSRWQKNPPLSLACVAGLTPPSWEVKIIDEAWETHDTPDTSADLIGVTAFTSQAPRAYAILDMYRKAGVLTAMGGIHCWAEHQEASRHADITVTGEAELAWDRVLTSLSPGDYYGPPAHCFATPRYDLLDSRYEIGAVQMSRGCPNHCTFCSVSAFSGTTMRRADPDDVVHDLIACRQDMVFAVDDNLAGSIGTLRAIAAANTGKKLAGQCDVDAIQDVEFLKAASAAGVKLLLVGLEANDAAALKSVAKRQRPFCADEAHRHGIAILGAYVFGFDTDNRQTMLDRAKYIVECGSDCTQVSMLTPLPGTVLYRQLEQRILYPRDWGRFDFGQLVHLPSGFTSVEEFYDVMLECVDIIYAPRTMKQMASRCLSETGSLTAAGYAYATNDAYATMAKLRSEQWIRETQCV